VKAKLRVKQTRSVIGQSQGMRVTIKGLGLRGPGSEVVVQNTPSFRGAIKKVIHLVSVEETDA
jgi:large subunit ribosomal protein L30